MEPRKKTDPEIPVEYRRAIRAYARSRGLLVRPVIRDVLRRGMKSLGIPTTEVDGETDGRDTVSA